MGKVIEGNQIEYLLNDELLNCENHVILFIAFHFKTYFAIDFDIQIRLVSKFLCLVVECF